VYCARTNTVLTGRQQQQWSYVDRVSLSRFICSINIDED